MKILSAVYPIAGVSLILSTSCSRVPEKNNHPNIIFIMSDDHAWQALSAYGGEISQLAPTPNIDRIAQNGMRFDRCLVTNSISGPSRATILTGKYSHKNGFISNERKDFDGSQPTYPKLLQQSGYTTAVIGKWHLGSQPTGFDHWEILPGQGQYYNPDFIDSTGTHRESGYVTELITQKTLKWLSQAKETGKPFMLMMHHKAPHREWEPGPKELSLYKDVVFPEPPSLFDTYEGLGEAEKSQDMTISKTMRLEEDLKLWIDKERRQKTSLGRMDSLQESAWDKVYDPIVQDFYSRNLKGRDLVSYKYQRYLQDYLACIAAVDKSVGEVLDYLKKEGLEENTLVVYTSDQGFYLGEHGWFDKRFIFEESCRTPLLIQWPGVIKRGSVNTNIVSNLDLAETFLDAAGLAIPGDMQGASMIPLIKGEKPDSWRTAHYYHYYEYPGYHRVKRHYGVVTDRYKLVHFYYDIDEWELFDLHQDPQEMKNAYSNPAYETVRQEMHEILEQLREKYGDSDSVNQSFLPHL